MRVYYLHPDQWRMNLTLSLLVSGIIHLFLVLMLPGFSVSRLIPPKAYIEVTLLPPPRLVKKQTPPAPPKKRKAEAEKWQALAPRLPRRGRNLRVRSYQPLVKLPSAVNMQGVINLLPEQAFSVDDLVKVPLAARPITPSASPSTAGVPETSPQPASVEISWSGPPRRYLYKPPDPSYSSPKRLEGEVKLKFWVDPQGKVSNVVVLRKLDAHLEHLATDYMKRWRFEQLQGKQQELQWGTINIKFRQE